MTASNLPIAMFDSGVGGLTVLDAISKLLPNENLIYLGDTARVPYGTRARETIIRYSMTAARKLLDSGAKILVIACNTATSAALETIREEFSPLPVIGVVEPGARSAVAATRNKKIAVIGTEATIRGRAYEKAINGLDGEITVLAQACSLFVPLAEEGWLSGEATRLIARKYLEKIFHNRRGEDRADTLLLGCTHFPLLLSTLREIVGEDVEIVDSARATAKRVEEELASLGLLRKENSAPARKFMITDNPERFIKTGTLFLGRQIEDSEVAVVDL